MRIILLFMVAAAFLISCSPRKRIAQKQYADTVYVPENWYISGTCDTVYSVDTLILVDTVLVNNSDSLIRELNLANFKIARVDHYLKIVERNPSQMKFLIGWLRRTIKK